MVLTTDLSSSWRPDRSIIRLCFLLGDGLSLGLKAKQRLTAGRCDRGGGLDGLIPEMNLRVSLRSRHQSR